MPYHIAFDRDESLEFFLFKTTAYRKEMFCTTNKPIAIQDNIGTLLLMFLNTDFEDFEQCSSFIYHFCFHNFYREKYPNKIPKNYLYSIQLKPKEFVTELKSIAIHYQPSFLYVKHTLLKNLNLPYNIDFLKGEDEEDDGIDYDKNDVKDANAPYDLIEINSFMEGISLDLDLFRFLLGGIYIFSRNIPYGFSSESIFSIIGLEFKEFMACKNHTIRKCQNCGYYFIPTNLKETKYCNVEFEGTGKTCRQIGKELAYKKSLKEDKALDMYRKRYMSLASSVSHYGTDKAIERFEKYKTEGAIMKAKYQNKEITVEEFEKWINSTKNT